MNSYLQLRFTNDFNEKFRLRIDNYDPDITDEDLKTAMDSIILSEVFTGKMGLFDKKLSASLVTVTEKEYSLD